jgi:hypothetical protein
VRNHLVRAVGVAALSWAAAVIAGILVLAWLLVGANGWRPGSDVPALLDAVIVLSFAVGFLLVRAAVRRAFAEAPLASSMERAVGLPSGILKGALELSRATPRGVSESLAERAVSGAVRGLEGRDAHDLSGSLGERVARWSRRGRGAASGAILVLVALTVAAPGRTRNALAGVLTPIATATDPVLPPLSVRPGDVEVLRGMDVELEVSAPGRVAVRVAWQAAGDIARSERVEVVEGRATHTFRTVAATIEYRIDDDEGGSTGTYRIVPVDPLFVSDLVVTVAYPAHTGIPMDEYRGDPPPLGLSLGSTLSFEGRTSRALSSVSLVDSTGTEALGFGVQGSTFEADWAPREGGSFEWDFRDQAGGSAEIQPEPLEVTVVPDRIPAIAISQPGRDTVMPLNLRQPLLIEASDDYGLLGVELVAYRVTSIGERMEPVSQGFQVGGQRAIFARPVLDLTRWGLLPGDTVRYYARAIDNNPAAQSAVSAEYVLRMPEAAQLRRAAEEAFEGVAEKLEELAAEAERQAMANRDQALEAQSQADQQEASEAGSAEDFEEREELQRSLEDQQAMSAEVDSLRAEMEAMEQLLEEAGQADPELRRQLEELQEMLERMTGDELQQRMDELQDALDQENLDQANQSLEEMAGQQEEFRERLEEARERFKRAALEQDFRATTTEAEELAQQEQALADALEQEDQPEIRASQQEELARQAEELGQRMEDLQERLAEQGEMDAAEGVQEARERTAEARQQMQEAASQAEQGQTQEAGEQAQEAAQEMQQAAEEMQQAMQQMAQQQMEAQQQALLRTADDALALARRQDELRERMRGAGQEQLASMRAEQQSMLQGVQNMAENLQVATEGAADANRELSAQMGLAMESLQNTVEAMEGRRGSAPSPTAQAEQAIGDLNQLALMAIAGAEQMGQQGQGEGGEDVAEQLEQLAQQQGELMNQSTQLMPMQLGEQTMSQQLEQMQQGQQSVASDLGDLADEPGSEESLGDLDELAREAMAIAQELEQGRLTPEMVRRQERLFHRLLDAGRSLEREEFSEERESEQPGEFERGQIRALTADQLGVMPYEIPDGAQLQQLSPAVRQLVLEYFERLNRARPPGGGS